MVSLSSQMFTAVDPGGAAELQMDNTVVPGLFPSITAAPPERSCFIRMQISFCLNQTRRPPALRGSFQVKFVCSSVR